MRASIVRLVPLVIALAVLAGVSPARTAPVTRMWQVVQTPRWNLMVRSIERVGDPVTTADGATLRPAGRFAVFVIDLTNRTGEPLAPNPDDFSLTAAGAATVSLVAAPAAGVLASARDAAPFGAPIAPGATARTLLLFDIDAHAGLGTLTLHFRPAADRPITIDECHCNLPLPSRMGAGG